MAEVRVLLGDCQSVMSELQPASVDLIYVDPPFFTQRQHKSGPRHRQTFYSFDDRWESVHQYGSFLTDRIVVASNLLKKSGSLFFHCDKTASHVARVVLDSVFGPANFRSEVIWRYKRWSNTTRNLLPAHQTILFYSKSKDYKFNTVFGDYSPTTNVDQILQKRSRDEFGKSVYARDEDGKTISNGEKRGVPLSDVWDIPFLNPKAKERTGYPTQKPILLLQRIIELTTDPGDVVLDPFCGSGTTLIAAQLLGRKAIGIDISEEAIEITNQRIENPIRTESNLLRDGIASYDKADKSALALLNGIPHIPVHRNNGIDAFLQATYKGVPIPVRVQKPGESLSDAAEALCNAARTKNAGRMILVATEYPDTQIVESEIPESVLVVSSAAKDIAEILANLD